MNIETANRLIELRKRKGLSQEELAAALGISRQAVSKWERAEAGPDVDNAILLSRLYKISLDELFGNKPEYERALERLEQEAAEETAEPEPEVIEEPCGSAPEQDAECVGGGLYSGVDSIVLNLRADVELICSEDGICSVELDGPESEQARCRIFPEGGVLHIETEEKQRHFFSGWRSMLKVRVRVPEGLKSIEGRLIGGDIRIKDIEVERINVKTLGGDVKTRDIRTGELSISTGGGDISLARASASRAELTTGGGEIGASDIHCSGPLTVTTGGGDVNVSGSASSVIARTGGGDITVSFEAETLDAKSGGGDISMMAKGVWSIDARTGGGDITAKLIGCSGVTADLASMGGDAEFIFKGTSVASGKRISANAGDGSVKIQMRSGGGDIKVEA